MVWLYRKHSIHIFGMQEAGGLGLVWRNRSTSMLNKCCFLPCLPQFFVRQVICTRVYPAAGSLAPRPVRLPPPSPSHRPCPFLLPLARV
jgi:hypothetical protein